MNIEYLKAVGDIIRTGHWITDQVNQELKDTGITEPQYNVMRILKAKNGQPVTVQEIQEGMVQRTSNVTRIIDKLISKDLVCRDICKVNRRKMDNTLTSTGNRLLLQLDKKVHSFHEPMAENLTNEEAKNLTRLIKKLKGDR